MSESMTEHAAAADQMRTSTHEKLKKHETLIRQLEFRLLREGSDVHIELARAQEIDTNCKR